MKKKSKNRLQINIKHNHNKIMENIQRVRIRHIAAAMKGDVNEIKL